MANNNQKDMYLQISPLFKSRSGKAFTSVKIDKTVFDALQQVEVGGKFIFTPGNSDKNEDYAGQLKYITAAQVKEFSDAATKRDGGRAATRAPSARTVEANDDL